MNDKLISRAADNVRILAASMVEKAKSGHPGGAMGGADFVSVLYSEFLNWDPTDMEWRNRDRFFLDPGHMSPMLYSILTLTGNYTLDEISNFRQWGSPTPGHPEKDFSRGVENTSGPLGQGHTMAVGAAIAERYLVARFGEWMSHKIYTFISDGGVQEEISQGAGRIAGHLGLGNLIMFYDSNDIQLSTTTSEVTSEDTAKKYEAWNWHVQTIEGNNVAQIREALKNANAVTDRPSIIIGKTIMGKGAVDANGNSYERKVSTHGMPLGEAGADYKKSVANLGGNPESPFEIFSDVKDYFASVLKEKAKAAKIKKEEEAKWVSANPELASKLEKFYSMDYSELDFSSIDIKDNVATRAASANVLAYLADNVENLLVASADLANSDKTDGFLKKTKALAKNDFSGSFLQAGVAELTMAVICNGIALHGGVRPACGTFFVFSDYMKPAARLSALMQLPVIFIWTHDAFRVGEDGPTHQPIEQEAQIRLLEELKNHAGKNSTLVLRPCDGVETAVSWKLALENTNTPTALILSRQNITNLPVSGVSRYEDALQAAKGGYIAKKSAGEPDVVLVGNGSEVATLIEGAALLEEKANLKVQVAAVPSIGLFFNQDAAYRNSVIPEGKPVYGLTAGLPSTLLRLVGSKGKVHGMYEFGHSAPYTVLDKKLGYTGENVYNQVVEYVKNY
ncbi:MAG: transketolase [Bacteroidales bacterium]|nr:transketolase [Bacteroidales bacterium]MBN2819338.1 transketolase [Bacteroidales bacterium]